MIRRLHLILSMTTLIGVLAAQPLPVKVDESNIEVRFEGGAARFRMPVLNENFQDLPVTLRLEILDGSDSSVASVELARTLQTGLNQIDAAIPFLISPAPDPGLERLFATRLFWRVQSETSHETQSGLVSLLRVAPGLFTLWVDAPGSVGAAESFPVHLAAGNPMRGDRAAGASVEATLLQGDSVVSRASATLDELGIASHVLKTPPDPFVERLRLTVDIRLADYVRRWEQWITIDNPARIALSLDKPLYQPGETLKARLLAYQPGRLLADQAAKISVEGPDGTQVFTTSLTTSKWGVAAAEWRIPEELGSGVFEIEASLDSPRWAESVSDYQAVEVRRYELPNFAVQAETDRRDYAPDDRPQVRVRADYLSGRPVAEGDVRITRSPNYSEDTPASQLEVASGRLRDGVFETTLDLAPAREYLEKNPDYQEAVIRYDALVTDDSTRRTEQRAFSIPISRGGIHLSSFGFRDSIDGTSLQFFVTATYPDGTPADCLVQIRRSTRKDEPEAPLLGEFRTNRFGLARIRVPSYSAETLKVTAHDDRGRSGSTSTPWFFRRERKLSLRAAKSLHRRGEDIRISLWTAIPVVGFLEVYRDSSVLFSKRVDVGAAGQKIDIPHQEEFAGQITLVFHSTDEGFSDTQTVLFPEKDEIELKTDLGGGQFRPGDTVDARFRMREAKGGPMEGVLGLLVLDRSVIERARTDSGREGEPPSVFLPRPQSGPEFAGLSLPALARLKLDEDPPADLDLAAEALLTFADGGYYRSGTKDSISPSDRLFADSPLGKSLHDIRLRLQSVLQERSFGSSDSTVRDWLAAQTESLRDPWGNPFRIEVEPHWGRVVIHLLSLGPDETFATPDDLLFLRSSWNWFEKQEALLRAVLGDYQKTHGDSVHDVETVERLLREAGLTDDDWLDPWGNRVRLRFRFHRDLEVLEALHTGPIGQFRYRGEGVLAGFAWLYFTPRGRELEQALARVRQRTGRAIDQIEDLKTELLREGFDLDQARDHWGRLCQPRLEVERTRLMLSLISPGEDGRISEQESYRSDDFRIWKALVADTFHPQRRRILEALRSVTKDQPSLDSVEELKSALRGQGVVLEEYSDYWGNPMEPRLEREATAQVWVADFAAGSGFPSFRPVFQDLRHFRLVSRGPDGETATADDFDAVSFTFATSETPDPSKPRLPEESVAKLAEFQPETGAILGKVIDSAGAVIPGVPVQAFDANDELRATTVTDESGEFALVRLDPGPYRIVVALAGFVTREISTGALPSRVLEVTVPLQIGDVSEEVTVSAGYGERVELATTSSTVVSKTPVLRQYFPETLLWLPELPTDAEGQAEIRFQLADTVTTWQMEALGATIDGRLARSVTPFTAFQPFFVDLDPPPFLTEGDELGLSPVVRNYTESDRTVDVQVEVSNGLTLLPSPGSGGASAQKLETPAGRSAIADFRLRAVASSDSAPVRVTAVAGDAGDAIQKTIRVLPDGERITDSRSLLWNDRAEFPFELPADTIAGSAKVRLVFYPGVLSQAVEAVDALLDQPGGCAEQITSLGLANLRILRALQSSGKTPDPAYAKALRLTRESTDRLVAVRQEDGGFSYWRRGDADAALTAYVLTFLRGAAEFVDIDPSISEETAEWLLDERDVRDLWSRLPLENLSTALFLLDDEQETRQAAERALDSVEPLIKLISDPMVLATYALLASKLGRFEHVPDCLAKLEKTASRTSTGSVHWSPSGGTPFYGWGRAGRIETTAMVLSALLEARSIDDSPRRDEWDQLAVGAAAYLAESKDSRGGWFSTRAAAAALEALFEFAGETLPGGPSGRVDVLVNGKKVADLEIPAELSTPIRFDLTPWIDPETRAVAVRRASTDLKQVVQLAWSRYRPWSASDAGEGLQAKNGLQFRVEFDKTDSMVGEPVTAQVTAQRHQWPAGAPRGMVLAEIGLPPGAEVDRAGLERELDRVGWSFGRYEVAPDRLTLYFWPSEKPIRMTFQFRPRHVFRGVAPSSSLYDYYNPDARATLAPAHFVFR